MKQTKTEKQAKVTVVDEEALQQSAKQETSEVADELANVTVVDVPQLEYWRARLIEVMRSPSLFAMSLGFALFLGYVTAFLQFTETSPGEAPVSGAQSTTTPYANFTNQALRNSSLDFTNELRKFLLERGVEENQMVNALMAQMSGAQSEDTKQATWQMYSASSDVFLRGLSLEFATRFSDKAIILRNELLARTSGKVKANVEMDYLYKQAATPGEIRQVMDDLANLAESLLTP